MLTRRTPLKPGKPLARKTPLKSTGGLKRGGALPRKRAKPRRSSRKRDEAYLRFVRRLPCARCDRRPPNEAHHATYGRGYGQKSDDDQAIPMCGGPRGCHGIAQRYEAEFANMTQDERRAWHAERVEETRALYLAQQGAVVKQRLEIKLTVFIEHETDEPGVTPALDHFAYGQALRDRLVADGVIKGPAVVMKGGYREIVTTQEPAA